MLRLLFLQPQNQFQFNKSSLNASIVFSREESLLTDTLYTNEISNSLTDKVGAAGDIYLKDGNLLQKNFVYGEFHHRSELSRIHNSICCVTQNFESIIHEGIVSIEGGNDGYTSFADYFFVSEDSTMARNQFKSEKLDDIPWIYEFNLSSIERRHQWKFNDEVNVSKVVGGPYWLINARARSTFVPMTLLLQHYNVNVNDPFVQSTKHALTRGSISFEEAMEKMKRLSELTSKQRYSLTLPSSPEKLRRSLDIESNPYAEDPLTKREIPKLIRNATPIISNSFLRDLERLPAPSEIHSIPASTNEIHSSAETSNIHERLDKLDLMIGKLVSTMGSNDISYLEGYSNKTLDSVANQSDGSKYESRNLRNSVKFSQDSDTLKSIENENELLKEEIKRLRSSIEEKRRGSLVDDRSSISKSGFEGKRKLRFKKRNLLRQWKKSSHTLKKSYSSL